MHLGYALSLAGLCLIAALGVPIPMAPILVAAGALAADGRVNPLVLFLAATIGFAIGDNLLYMVGRGLDLGLGPSLRRFLRRLHPGVQHARARKLVGRRREWTVFFSRFTFLSAPVSLAAGASRFPWQRFLLADLLGEAGNAALDILLGYGVGRMLLSLLPMPYLAAGSLLLLLLAIGLSHIWRKPE